MGRSFMLGACGWIAVNRGNAPDTPRSRQKSGRIVQAVCRSRRLMTGLSHGQAGGRLKAGGSLKSGFS
jgi:hypothetical protein